MYIDESVQLPDMPKWLRNDVDDLVALYREGDEVGFLCLEEPVCAWVKAAVEAGELSKRDGYRIFEYFGWR